MKASSLLVIDANMCVAAIGTAQVPQGISYQAVLRNGSGGLLANTSVDMQHMQFSYSNHILSHSLNTIQ